jgi:ABC-type dipeptide/oligopeptide/nickel transport system permease subunit
VLLLRNPKSRTGLAMVLFAAVIALIAPLISVAHPNDFNLFAVRQAPSWHHLFGTTDQGSDIFSQVVLGARRSLLLGAGAGALATGLAVVLGITAAYSGGIVGDVVNFLIVAGLGSLGTGVKLAIFDAAGRDHYADTSWVMCAGMALFLAGLGVIHLVTPPTRADLDVALRFGSAAYALALVPLVTVVPPAAIAWLLAAAGIAQVGVELFHHGERSAEAAAQPT